LSERALGVRAILVLTGAAGSGKTTVATLLGEALSSGSLLYIDATPDQALSALLAPEQPGMSLAQLFSKSKTGSTVEATKNAIGNKEEKAVPELTLNGPAGREAIDWTFNDLTVSVGEESDLLLVGDLNHQLDLREQEKLTYGLRRLIDGYQVVIMDGEDSLLLSLLPQEVLRILSVVTPDQFKDWRSTLILEGESTPALVLNAYSGEPLPEALENALQGEHLRLIAKIPRYANDAEREAKMSQHFESALLRLNIPIFPV
jgi:cellulose biosynthesis protein BcsQ